MSGYIVFDVETPNRASDRMSAIGITVIEENSITHEFYSLVNPETYCKICLFFHRISNQGLRIGCLTFYHPQT